MLNGSLVYVYFACDQCNQAIERVINFYDEAVMPNFMDCLELEIDISQRLVFEKDGKAARGDGHLAQQSCCTRFDFQAIQRHQDS